MRNKLKQRIGETVIANNELKATLIDYRRSDDIDVRFEDGTIVTGIRYYCFKQGIIKHGQIRTYNTEDIKKKRIGETVITNTGLKATIIEYRNNRDIDVQLETGEVIYNVRYQQFKKGYGLNANRYIRLKDGRVGETHRNNQGMLMTIIAYRSRNDIDIELEDGQILKHREYRNFLKGSIKSVKTYTRKQITRIGETHTSSNGLLMKIVKYNSSNDMSIEFEDGTIIDSRAYAAFQTGNIAHPKFKKAKEAYQYEGMKYFLCTCKQCKRKHVLSLEEMRNFKCHEDRQK